MGIGMLRALAAGSLAVVFELGSKPQFSDGQMLHLYLSETTVRTKDIQYSDFQNYGPFFQKTRA